MLTLSLRSVSYFLCTSVTTKCGGNHCRLLHGSEELFVKCDVVSSTRSRDHELSSPPGYRSRIELGLPHVSCELGLYETRTLTGENLARGKGDGDQGEVAVPFLYLITERNRHGKPKHHQYLN